jgi:hypothetical protein
VIWVQLGLGVVAAFATIVAAWYAREAATIGKAAVEASQTTIHGPNEEVLTEVEVRREDDPEELST